MNALQKLDAEELRIKIFTDAKGMCAVCGWPLNQGVPQLAHRIANTKANIKKYGDEIINHRLNLVATCSLYCNSRCNIGNNPVKSLALVEEIKHAIEHGN